MLCFACNTSGLSSVNSALPFDKRSTELTPKSQDRLLRVTKSEKLLIRKPIDLAYEEFYRNLEMFRRIVPIETICMHGSPRSKFDNKAIWQKYDYKKLGIIGEPYFDIDFKKVAYLTDTGRRWNGDKVSIRDKVKSPFNFNFRSTSDIIKNISMLPDKAMFTFHPQRWTDDPLLWTQELILQNIKNIIKRFYIYNYKFHIAYQKP